MFRTIVNHFAANPRFSDLARHCLENQFHTLKAFLRDFLGDDPGLALDCGCGTGIFATEVPSSRYLGIDISEANLKAARNRCPQHRFMNRNAADLPFEDDVFDRIFVVGMLHHLDDQEIQEVCRELRRALKENGKLLVVEDIPTPNLWNLVGHAVHHFDVGSHIRTVDGYRKILEQHFRIDRLQFLKSGFMDYAAFHCLQVIEESSHGNDYGKC